MVLTVSFRISDHAKTLLDLPDEYLRDIGPVLKKVASSTGVEQYNILQVRISSHYCQGIVLTSFAIRTTAS